MGDGNLNSAYNVGDIFRYHRSSDRDFYRIKEIPSDTPKSVVLERVSENTWLTSEPSFPYSVADLKDTMVLHKSPAEISLLVVSVMIPQLLVCGLINETQELLLELGI